jgi:hypothetical protein
MRLLETSLPRWLFRLARDEQLPIVLTQRRIFIVPTRGRCSVRRRPGGDADRRHQLQPQPRPRADLPARRARPGGDGAHLPQPVRPAPDAGARRAHFSPATWRASRCRSKTRAGKRGVGPSISPSTSSRRSRSTCRPKAARRSPFPSPRRRRGRLDPGRMTLATRYPLGLFRAWSYPHPRVLLRRLSPTDAHAAAATVAGTARRQSAG